MQDKKTSSFGSWFFCGLFSKKEGLDFHYKHGVVDFFVEVVMAPFAFIGETIADKMLITLLYLVSDV
ncbi:hypothetical protein ACIMOV_25085, partial [Escherichia coli]